MKSRRIKGLVFFMVCCFPCFLFLNSWQVYRYDQTEKRTRLLEQEQERWYELNKRLATRITEERSPEKLEEKAKEENLRDGSTGEHIHIRLRSSNGDGDE